MKKNKGFTLMELTIVLAILAIIAVILVPAFLTTTDRARLRSDIQSARVIQNAIDLYRLERGIDPTGGTVPLMMEHLVDEGFLSRQNASVPSSGAVWYIRGDRVIVDIGGIEGLYSTANGLPIAERRMVYNGSTPLVP